MSKARRALYDLVHTWDEEILDTRDHYPFRLLLDEILFHADFRFVDYIQYQDEGEFPERLRNWLENLSDHRHKRILFRLLAWLFFIDRSQMRSMYRDAYRRIIRPWVVEGELSARDMLSADYEARVRGILRRFVLLSVTESFVFPEFLHVNDLHGLPDPTIVGEQKERVAARLPRIDAARGIVILEDFVGTGGQASGVLSEIAKIAPASARLLFVPLIILERGRRRLARLGISNLTVHPVVEIPYSSCIRRQPFMSEPPEFKQHRSLIKVTEKRVLERFDSDDDPPRDAFGYRGSGALLVTCHNTPNNSLPLIHHRAPRWSPLFRRVHHSKDGLR